MVVVVEHLYEHVYRKLRFWLRKSDCVKVVVAVKEMEKNEHNDLLQSKL